MPDLFNLFRSWWKPWLAFVLLATIIVGTIVFLQPQQYAATTTAIPANTFATDKASIFSDNVQQLYTALGNPDDLDRIIGTAQLDTIYLAIASQLPLADHYRLTNNDDATGKAASQLKSNTRVTKSAYGELKIKVWDTDPSFAAQLANAVFTNLQSLHQYLQAAGNEATLHGLIKRTTVLQLQLDSTAINNMETAQHIREQLQRYNQLVDEYQLMVDHKPPTLVVVERAKPASHPDKPKRLQLLLVTVFLSSIFGLLLALILERTKLSGS